MFNVITRVTHTHTSFDLLAIRSTSPKRSRSFTYIDVFSAEWIPTFEHLALSAFVIDLLRKSREDCIAAKAMKNEGRGGEGRGGRTSGYTEVDERVGSHVDVKDRNCEFVDPRLE